MTIEITGAFEDGKHARILHDGNRFRAKSITTSSELPLYPSSSVDDGSTVDRWRPFENQLTNPSDFSGGDWDKFNVTVAGDGQTLNEGFATGFHLLEQTFTFTAIEWVVAAQVTRQSVTEVEVLATDGTAFFAARFDLETLTVTNEGATGKLVSLGGDRFECRIYFTPAAGTGSVQVVTGKDGERSYTGTGRTLRVHRVVAHPSVATLDLNTFGAQAGDCIGVAAHNLGTSAGRIVPQHDSDGDDNFTVIGDIEPNDDSPIMFFFDAITSASWRIALFRGVLPEIGVFRVGTALKMQRTFYGGASIGRMNRVTEIVANVSGSGELLGRSKKRTILTAPYQWENLTYDWVRANLDGPSGLIQSAEVNPLFVAWRPSETQDVDYVMRAQAELPVAQGQANLWSFSMSAEAHAYE